MSDLRTKLLPVASPCTSVCALDPASGWCLGCFRTIDEIAAWGLLDDDARRAVVAALPARRSALASGPHGSGAR